jgi:hypothetical protein
MLPGAAGRMPAAAHTKLIEPSNPKTIVSANGFVFV